MPLPLRPHSIPTRPLRIRDPKPRLDTVLGEAPTRSYGPNSARPVMKKGRYPW
jgi:hypothetical protein